MKQLVTAYFCIWIVSAVIIALFMEGVLPQGIWATDGQIQYVCSLICVIITLLFIYLGLKMLAMPKIKAAIKEKGFTAYFYYAGLRNFIALVVTVVDLLAYFCTLLSSCGFCWLICILSLFFIKPGQNEFNHLVGKDETAGN